MDNNLKNRINLLIKKLKKNENKYIKTLLLHFKN